MVDKGTILMAPLDWGLGHATRCIPIINELLSKGFEVIIAAEGPVKVLLKQEFSKIEYLPLKGYNISYSNTRLGLFGKIIRQIPRILHSISYEKRWLNEILKKKKIDIVISDNRFGLHNKKIYSIFITHQLLIKAPLFQHWLQKINYHFINKFDECWVPDFKGHPHLAGELSHPKKMPSTPLRYIGWLSRFEKEEEKEPTHLLILLSGPEPQRSLLEEKILGQLENFSSPVLLVRGLPGNKSSVTSNQNIKYANHLPAKELKEAILHSSFIIARSGYSTVMDLLKLQKKTILIPTPGQLEQEYLGRYLLQKQLAFSISQKNFDLEKVLEAANTFSYSFYNNNARELLKDALSFDVHRQSNNSITMCD
jgi:uncharacterized protein (TIGR00661 family)